MDNYQIDFHRIFPEDSYDFRFITANNEEIRCHKQIAAFISPKISRELATDPLMDTFMMKTSFNVLKGFVNYGYCHEIRIEKDDLVRYLSVAKKLENEYIGYEIIKRMSNKSHADTLIMMMENNILYGIEDEINYVAKEFSKARMNVLANLSVEILSKILSSPYLDRKKEDDFFDDILKIIKMKKDDEDEEEVYKLLSYVDFINLSHNKFQNYQKRLKTANYLEIAKNYIINEPIVQKLDILIEENTNFNGILQYLKNNEIDFQIESTQSDYNDIKKGVKNKIENILDKDPSIYWKSEICEENPWFMIDFGDHEVSINRYFIETYDKDMDSGHMRSWKIIGSKDGKEWDDIDFQNTDVLNNFGAKTVFLTTFNANYYKFIKFIMHGENFMGLNQLNISRFDIFGHIL